MERASRKRAAGRVPERVASSRGSGTASPSRGGPAREDIIAARRERRAKEKAARASSQQPSQGARYRRKRGDSTAALAEEYDPLDAENAGLHDAALEQGHEEIRLNLEGFEPESAPADLDDTQQHDEDGEA